MSRSRGSLAAVSVLAALMSTGSGVASATPTLPPAGKAWGFNAQLVPPTPALPAGVTSLLPAAQLAGATHMRVAIFWAGYSSAVSPTNPIPASLDPTTYPVGTTTPDAETNRADGEYLALTNVGITPVLIIEGVPSWASTFHSCTVVSPTCPSDWAASTHGIYYPAADYLSTYATFVQDVAARYPLSVIEGPNEPDAQAATFGTSYVPPMSAIAAAQCTLASAVAAAGNGQKVLSSGMFDLRATDAISIPNYLTQIHADEVASGASCYDDFSFHLYTGWDTRTGIGSQFANSLSSFRTDLSASGNGSRKFWITEVGISNTVPSDSLTGTGPLLPERTIAHAIPSWLTYLAGQGDIGGVLIDTIRDKGFAPENAWADGYGFLDTNLMPKNASGELPRWCYLTLSAGNTDPNCSGWSLPASPSPGSPTWFATPIISDTTPNVGDTLLGYFLEDATPAASSVTYVWTSCNILNVCSTVSTSPFYTVPSTILGTKIKLKVTITNSYGSINSTTALTSTVL